MKIVRVMGPYQDLVDFEKDLWDLGFSCLDPTDPLTVRELYRNHEEETDSSTPCLCSYDSRYYIAGGFSLNHLRTFHLPNDRDIALFFFTALHQSGFIDNSYFED